MNPLEKMTDYPRFNGYYVGSNESAGMEILVAQKLSILPSISNRNKSFAIESRLYLENKNKNLEPFISARISTRNRASLGFGLSSYRNCYITFLPVFGVSSDSNTGNVAPFISLSLGINPEWLL